MSVQTAGSRRFVVAVQRHNGKEEGGEPTYYKDTDWDNLIAKLPVRITGVVGGERVRGQQMESITTHLIEVPMSPRTEAIAKTDRIMWAARVLNIVRIMDTRGLERELSIQCKESE